MQAANYLLAIRCGRIDIDSVFDEIQLNVILLCLENKLLERVKTLIIDRDCSLIFARHSEQRHEEGTIFLCPISVKHDGWGNINRKWGKVSCQTISQLLHSLVQYRGNK